MFLRNSIGSYPKGISQYGVLDMAGNVEEWTSTLGKDYPYDLNDGREDLATTVPRVLRGGSFSSSPDGVCYAYRYSSSTDYRVSGFGFGVALSTSASEN